MSPNANVLVSELIREDPDMRDLVEEFVGSLQTRLSDLQSAFSANDWGRLQVIAHQLKGAGGSYGYPDMTRVAAEMETRFKQQVADGFEHSFGELQQLIAAAQRGLA